MATSSKAALRIEQVAERLNVSLKTVRRLLLAGDIVGFRVGRVWRIDPAAVEDYVHMQRERVRRSSGAPTRSSSPIPRLPNWVPGRDKP